MAPSAPRPAEKALRQMRATPTAVKFAELKRVRDHFFGSARQTGSSHLVYKMPWSGDPRVNIQNHSGKAKAYQVRQVLQAVDRLSRERTGRP